MNALCKAQKAVRRMRQYFACLMLAATMTIGWGAVHAATYSLPANIGSGPFIACSFFSGTTYQCGGTVDFGNDNGVVLNITSNMTLQIGGSFVVGNNLTVNASPGVLTLLVGGSVDIQNNLTGTLNINAGGTVNLGQNTALTGNITAGGAINIGSGTVTGACNKANGGSGICNSGTLSVASVSLAEGNAGSFNMTFAITRSATSGSATTVTYTTTAGSATAGASCSGSADYITTTGTATIAAGSTTTTFNVPICGDTTIELNETFTVTLSAASNATISTNSATGTITNDDLCTCVPQNGNLIANPDFEELCASTIVQNFGAVNGGTVNMRNGVCGWAMNGAGMETWENTTTTPASKGTVFVEIDGYSGTVDCLWQNVATSPGTDYTLKVDYRARTTTREGLIVKWNGTQKYSTTAAPTSAWLTITVPGLTATGNDRIEFCEPSASDNALGSWIDNVRLQTFFPDHYELSVPSSNVSCQASTVKVTACADSSSPCTNVLATPSTPTVNLATSAGTLASGTLTIGASGIATTTLSYPSAADGGTATLTLSGESVPGANARTCCIGSTCSTANTCVVTFKTAGFIFANTATGASATLPTQTAGNTSGTTYLRAVKTSTSTQACESALSGAQSVNWAAQCNNPTTCSTGNLMSLSGNATTAAGSSLIASNPNTGVSSTTSVNMTFDANGSAPFSFNYADAGQVTLWASKAASGSLLTALAGNSNAFVVKPATLVATATTAAGGANPGSTTTGGSAFMAAGDAFTVNVKGFTSDGVTPTPNFGNETTVPAATFVDSGDVAGKIYSLVTPTTDTPSIGVLTTGTSANGNSATAPVVTGTVKVTGNAWTEVGAFTLKPYLSNYLGAGVVSGTQSSTIGRFRPYQYVFSGNLAVCSSPTFAYVGQPLAGTLTVTAQNKQGGTTTNYGKGATSLATLTPAQITFGALTAGLAVDAASSLYSLAFASAQDFNTRVNGTAQIAVALPVKMTTPSNPITSGLTISATTDEVVTVANAPVSVLSGVPATTEFRLGRMRLQNAYGSERLALPVPLFAEYRNGGNWVRNTDDSCTSIVAPTSGAGLTFNPEVAASVKGNHLSSGETTATVSSTGRMVAGDGQLRLSAPGLNNDGYLSISIPLALMPWLQFPWTGGVNVDPTAQATFGIYKSPLIYRRENY